MNGWMCACTCINVCRCASMHQCIFAYICAYIHTYIHTHIHTYIHTYIHIHTHRHTHTHHGYVNFIIIIHTIPRIHALAYIYRQLFHLAKSRYFDQFRPFMILKLTFRFCIHNLCGCIRLICIYLYCCTLLINIQVLEQYKCMKNCSIHYKSNIDSI